MYFYRNDGSKFLLKDDDIFNEELIDKMQKGEDLFEDNNNMNINQVIV